MSTNPVPLPENSGGDATYLGKTLRHEPIDLLLDDSVGFDVIRAVWRRSTRLAIATFVIFLVIGLFTGGLFGSGSSSSSGGGGVILIGVLLAIGLFAGTWIAFLNSEKQEPISEWCTVLAGRAAAADSVYSHIAGKLRERALPIQPLAMRTPVVGTTENRLALVDGYHYVYVSVFSYGTSLYLGWNMWRVRKGSVLLQHYFGSSQRTGGLGLVGKLLNLERLKAMREAVHAVCREALHTAVANIEVPTSYGFPNGMPPIEGLPTAAPQPSAPRHDGMQWQAPPPGRR